MWRLVVAVVCLGSFASAQYTRSGIVNATLAAQNVSYSDAYGASLQGYFAYDNSTTARRGLVVIIPDFDGIGPYEQWRADILASLGYAALVADIYTTAVPQGPSLPSANRSELTRLYSGNQTLLVTRINGALDVGKKQAVVDPTKVAAIGYCFGGGAIMQLARSFPSPSTQGLRGVASFHGSQLAYKAGDKNFTQGNNVTVAIHNGFVDPSNNASQLLSIQQELQAALVPFYLTNYGETVHSFTEPTGQPWSPTLNSTAAYTRSTDVLSWWHLRGFLLYVFGDVDRAGQPYVGTTWDSRSNAFAYPTS